MPSTPAPASIDHLLPEPAAKPSKRVYIGAKLRVAIDAIVFEGMALDAAARKADCTTRAIRKALERPHVLAHLKRRREVLRQSACGANIHRLAQIRDAADNMPAVNAIKLLEQIGDVEGAASSAVRASPGLVIVIQGNVNASLTRSDAKPLIEHEVGSHDADD